MKLLTMIFLVFLLPVSPIVLFAVANKSINKQIFVRSAVICGIIFELFVLLGVVSIQRHDSAFLGSFFFLIYAIPWLLVRLLSFAFLRSIDIKPRMILFVIDGLLIVPSAIMVKSMMP